MVHLPDVHFKPTDGCDDQETRYQIIRGLRERQFQKTYDRYQQRYSWIERHPVKAFFKNLFGRP